MSQQTPVKAITATTDVVIRLVGESGEGTVSLGDLLVQMFVQMGLEIFTFQTFPAEIKGGTVLYQIRAKSENVLSQGDAADVLVALNDEGFDLFGERALHQGRTVRFALIVAAAPARRSLVGGGRGRDGGGGSQRAVVHSDASPQGAGCRLQGESRGDGGLGC